jgi:lipopolysaccharide export LptBFGC system permease protein LptF
VASFVARSKPVLRGVGAALAVVVLIVWNHPTALTVLGIAVVFVVYLVVLELLGRNATVEPAPETTATG